MGKYPSIRNRKLIRKIAGLCLAVGAVAGLFSIFFINRVTPVRSQVTGTRETPTHLFVTLNKVELSADANPSHYTTLLGTPSTVDVVGDVIAGNLSHFGVTNNPPNPTGDLSFPQGTYIGLKLTLADTGTYSGPDPCQNGSVLVTDQNIQLPGNSSNGNIVLTYTTIDSSPFRPPTDLLLQPITIGSDPIELRLVFLASNSVICSNGVAQLEKPLVLVNSTDPQNFAPQYFYNGFIDKNQGTSTGLNTSTTLNDTNRSFTVNQFVGSLVQIISGTDAGDVRTIISNTTNQLTVSPPWTTIPDSTSTYQIKGTNFRGYNFVWQINSFSPPLPFSNVSLVANAFLSPPDTWTLTQTISGLSTGSNTSTTLNDTTQSFTPDQFVNSLVQIINGTDAGDVRTIISNTDTQLTVSPPWTTTPFTDSTYQIFPQAGRLRLGCNSLPNGQGAPLVLFTMSPETGCPSKPIPQISSPVPAADGQYVVPYQITLPASSQISFFNFVSTSLMESSSASNESQFPRPMPRITESNSGIITGIDWSYLTNPFLVNQPPLLIVGQRIQMFVNLPCDPFTDNTCNVTRLGNNCYQAAGGISNADLIFDSGPLAPTANSLSCIINNNCQINNNNCPINLSYVKDIRYTVSDALGTSFVFDLSLNPTISSLSPTYGPASTSVTISGVNFGATQGTSTVTFNGTMATPSSWSDTNIVVPVPTVPTVATTGPVVVTVGIGVSNGVNFIVR